MKLITDEKGYTLILTLIILAVSSIFLMSFAVMSNNHNNLVEQTDDTFEVTSVAEMGVEYYHGRISYEIEKFLDPNTVEGKETIDAVNNINFYIENQKKLNKPIDQSVIDGLRDPVMLKMLGNIENILSNGLKPADANYYVSNYHSNNRSWNIEVTGSIPSSNKEKIISTAFTIPVDYHLIVENVVKNGNNYVPGTSPDIGFNNLINTDLFVQGNANIGSITSIKNSTITIDGNANVEKILGMDTQSIIDIKGKLTIDQSKNTTIKGILIINTIEYVGNYKKNDTVISIPNGGKLCVRDNTDTNLGILFGENKKAKATGDGRIYILNTDKPNNYNQKLKLGKHDTGQHTREVGIDVFENECGNAGASQPTDDNYIINTTPVGDVLNRKIKYLN